MRAWSDATGAPRSLKSQVCSYRCCKRFVKIECWVRPRSREASCWRAKSGRRGHLSPRGEGLRAWRCSERRMESLRFGFENSSSWRVRAGGRKQLGQRGRPGLVRVEESWRRHRGNRRARRSVAPDPARTLLSASLLCYFWIRQTRLFLAVQCIVSSRLLSAIIAPSIPHRATNRGIASCSLSRFTRRLVHQ